MAKISYADNGMSMIRSIFNANPHLFCQGSFDLVSFDHLLFRKYWRVVIYLSAHSCYDESMLTFHGIELVCLLFPYKIHLANVSFA